MQNSEVIKIGIIAGEHSGDLIGSKLIEQIKKDHKIKIYGIGGPMLAKVGLKSKFDFNELQVMGLIEPILKIRRLLFIRKTIKKYFLEKNIDMFIGVDSPDFNLNIHKYFKKRASTKTIQLVSPSVWGWRKGRLKNIKKYIDMTICLFNFEHTFYKENNHKSMHLGHPFVDLKEAHKDDVIKKYELNAAKKYISVLPGSRPSEIKNMMPIYLDAMKDIKKINDDYFFLIPAADHESKEQISNYVGDLGNTIIEVNAANDFLSLSDYSIVTSGTASLQAAVLNSFPIICYKTNFISYSIISRLLTIDMVGLPNLLLGKKVFPELIQDQCKSNQILNEITNINHNSNFINYKSLNIQGLLKGSGFERVSKQIISLLN